MHDEIIRYSLEGEISDANLESRKRHLIEFLEVKMKEDGVAPCLDLDPGWTLHYEHEKNIFQFVLSVYGMFMGGEIWEVAGVTNGKKIMKYTPPVRSKES